MIGSERAIYSNLHSRTVFTLKAHMHAAFFALTLF